MNKNAGHSPVDIHPLRANDRAAWDVMWAAYLAFYETELTQDIFDRTFARLTDETHPTMSAHIATLDQEPVGLVHYIFHDHCWRKGPVCYLQDLYTAPAARGKGVGQALIQSVYDAADRRGAESTYWLTQEFNSTARRLYDRVATVTPFIKYQRA